MPIAAALEAGFVRFRPVLMTALAMIIGMAPMALGLGEGGEQNAPLGRAVIGGLIFATIATLIFVPVVFSIVHRNHGKPAAAPAASRRAAMPSEHPPRRPGLAAQRLRIAGLVAGWSSPSSSWSTASGAARQRSAAQANGPTRRRCRPSPSSRPASAATSRSLDLPGRLEAYSRAPIYARVSGYLKSWYVDIGAPVKAGQLLAEIETPDLDQQLLQAGRALASAQAGGDAGQPHGAALAGAGRQQRGLQAGGRREDPATSPPSRRSIKAAQANVDRLLVLDDFKRIDGAVRRHRDHAQHRHRRADQCRFERRPRPVRGLRHPEAQALRQRAAELRAGGQAQHQGRDHRAGISGQGLPATVEASARSVDAASGTTRMQVVVDNSAGELMPGAFANTRIQLPENAQALSHPGRRADLRQGRACGSRCSTPTTR